MKLSKTPNKSTFLLTLLLLCLSTAFVEAQDSTSFSNSETKALLKTWVNYPKLQAYADSCDVQERLFRERIKNDSIEKHACKEAHRYQGMVITAQDDQITFYKKQSKGKRGWKIVSAVLGAIGLGEGLYIYGTKN